jgi:hypothetical protein
MNRVQLAGIGVLAGALTIVGAIGPWATGEILRHDIAGTDANRGVTVAVAAGVGLLLMALAGWRNLRWAAMLAAVAGLVAFGLTVWTLAALNSFVGAPAGLSVGKGWGIWLATIASLVLVVSAVAAAVMKDPSAAVEVPSGTTAN